MTVVIGVDPHKRTHTAVVIDHDEIPLATLQVRAGRTQLEELLAWSASFDKRVWAIESANGLGYLLGQQLVGAGERVLDVPATLSARVRVLATSRSNKNDPNDALSVAIAARHAPRITVVQAADHPVVLRLLVKRHTDLGRLRNRSACRLHALLCELAAGGISKEITPNKAQRLLDTLTPSTPVERTRHQLCPGSRRGPAAPRRAAARLAPTCRGGRHRVGDLSDRHLRDRADRRRHDHRPHPRRGPLREPRPLRRLLRDRTSRVRVRRSQHPPPLTTRQPADEPRDAHHCGHPDRASSLTWPRLLRPQGRRRQDPQRSAARTQAADQRRRVRPATRRGDAKRSGRASGGD